MAIAEHMEPDVQRGVRDVAIVHDFLNQRGGAERVVLEMAELFPGAPIYTSLYRHESTFPGFRRHTIHTTMLDRLPIDRGFRRLLPFYPAAFASLPPIDADVALVSSSAFAHHVRTTARTLSVVYCHTPPRWMYGGDYMSATSRAQAIARPVIASMRAADHRAAARADLYVANSTHVAERIRQTYGRSAVVVAPPVSVDRFRPTARGERLLVVSRLLPYKRIDLVIEAAARTGLGVDIIGQGPDLARLRSVAGPRVEFHGGLTDGEVEHMMQSCRSFVVSGLEDFGITLVEAQAAGKPVVAFGHGGALDTVVEGATGVFFEVQTVKAVADAIRRADALDTTPEVIAENAAKFSPAAFHAGMLEVIGDALAQRAR